MFLRRFLARGIAVPANDLIKKQSVSRDISTLRKAWSWDADKLNNFRLSRLKRLLDHSYANIDFYKKRFDSLGMHPEDIQTVDDLRKFPPLTRQDIADLKRTIRHTEKTTVQGTSSGSSGIPISYYNDKYSQSMGKASLYFGRMINGWKLGDRIINVWGNPKTVNTLWNRPSSKINAFLTNEMRIAACNLVNEIDMENAVAKIATSGAEFISGYSNSLKAIAGYISRKDIEYRCRRVFTTAETLFESDRELIEKGLGPVSDMYGCSEINGIAFQCPFCGLYHTVDPHVIVEFEEYGDGQYSLLITDLDNLEMPLIRYRVGDLVELPSQASICPGGTKWASFKSVRGRLSNIIEINGKYINPISYFGDTMGRLLNSILSNPVSYQTAWDGNAFTTTLYLEKQPEESILASLSRKQQELLDQFGVKHFFRVVVGHLEPSLSGKHSFFVNRSGDCK